MLKSGNQVRLTGNESQTLNDLVGMEVRPKTVGDYNKCLDYVVADADQTVPEDRIMAAVAARMKIVPEGEQSGS